MLRYRVRAFGKPQSPWRTSKRLAERDAETLDLGSRDEWGDFYLSAEATFDEVHEFEIMRQGEASRALSMTKPCQVPRAIRHQA